MNVGRWGWFLLAASAWACTTAGSTWMSQPLSTGAWGDAPAPEGSAQRVGQDDPQAAPPARVQARVLSDAPPSDDRFVPFTPGTASSSGSSSISPAPPKASPRAPGGRVLGTFRNTY